MEGCRVVEFRDKGPEVQVVEVHEIIAAQGVLHHQQHIRRARGVFAARSGEWRRETRQVMPERGGLVALLGHREGGNVGGSSILRIGNHTAQGRIDGNCTDHTNGSSAD